MSESQSQYDPMSIHADVDAMYQNQEVEAQLERLRLIMESEERIRRVRRFRFRSVDVVKRPDLFGDYGPAIQKPPIAPD